MKPSYGAATTVAYTFTLKDQRHVVVYDAPGKLFELLTKVIAELEVTKADVVDARESSPRKEKE